MPRKSFFITPCVTYGCTHASRAEIRIFTPRDIKFHTILMWKTFSWRVWLYHSPSARAVNSHSSNNVSSHAYRNVLLLTKYCITDHRYNRVIDNEPEVIVKVKSYEFEKKKSKTSANINFLYFSSFVFFTFLSHTEYVKRESFVIAWVKKKILSFWQMFMICMSKKTKWAKKIFRLSVCLDVWMYVRTWTFHVDTITFEGVSGSKQNLVGVFYVWNVGLVLKSKVISWSWSWSWSWFWTEF